ncbi:Kynurenine formamidase [Halopenitus malekzadehii]|uniref:Kynurenine formamidase n=1 Tax=Halopenitus malekzadehii TaxID=1267564 RepID=A0A1H6HV36_9EURY|nr:cyclase family protein [Halopenitus malekzadehii]SEH39481.1 Kynurenine formamidase [Halopenitus malekzadehii]
MPHRSDAYRDLSQPIESGMSTFPGDPPVELTPAATIADDGAAVHELHCGSHTGTHIDAPSHTESGGADLNDRPVGEYVFDARFLDVTPCSAREPIGADALPNPDALAAADLLVVRTGWDAHWNADCYRDHPYLTPAAARALREADCGVAIDVLNPDPTPSGDATSDGSDDPDQPDEPDGFPVHHALLGAGLPIVENLTNLDGLPDRFTLYAFPLPIAGADGAPVRAVAFVEEAPSADH